MASGTLVTAGRFGRLRAGVLLLTLMAGIFGAVMAAQINTLNTKTASLANGGLTTKAVSPDLRTQLEMVAKIAGAFPSSLADASCSQGQVLSFSNGQVVCVTLTTAANGSISVATAGIPGADGANSAGLNGANGGSGTNGSNGGNGSSGTSGTNGSSGINGTAGSSGTSGANGTTGSSGTNGNSGTVGATGATGPQGAPGAAGTTGPQGSPGVLSTTLGNGLSGSIAGQVLSMNIVTDPNGGLSNGSNGLALLASCGSSQLLKWNGSAWICANDNVGSTSTANLTSGTSGLTITGGTGAVLGSGTSIAIATATTGTNGLLSAVDWNTFSNKENALTFTGNGLFSRTGNIINAATCTTGQIMKSTGSTWTCSSDVDTDTTYLAGAGLSLSGNTFSLPNVGTAGTYGSATTIPVITTDTQGRISGVTTAAIPTANTSTTGLLNSTDWNTFNSKQTALALGNLTSGNAGVVTVTGGTGAVVGASGANITIATATSSQTGLLSSVDWNTFNNKENALTFTGSGLFSRSGNTVTAATCTNNQIQKYNGSAWVCSSDADTTYTAGTGLSASGTTLNFDPGSLTSVVSVAGSDDVLVYSGGTAKRVTYDNLFGNVLGSLNYRGTWNATTDSPTLTGTCVAGTKGYYYTVAVAGSTNLNGVTTWNVGDWAVCNGTVWQRVQTSSGVSSVFGRGGVITAQNGDYTASQITNTAAGSISSTTAQGAINELDSEKLGTSLASGLVFLGNASGVATGTALSGDATISNTGVVSLANSAVTSAKIADGTIAFADLASNSCSNGQTIVYNGSAWTCGAGGNTYTAANTGGNADTPLTISGTSIGFTDGTTSGQYWAWNGTKWTLVSPPAGMTIGAIDTQTKSANGAVIAGTSLFLQTADATNAGLVSTGTQTLAGNKTLSNNLAVNGNTTLGDASSDTLTINGTAVSVPNGVTMTSGAATNIALVTGAAGNLNFTTGTTGAITIDSGTTGAINIGTNANAKTLSFGNATGATGLVFTSGTGGLAFSSTATTTNASTLSGNSVTTADVQRIVANALTSGNAFNVTSSSTAFTGNLAKFGLTGSNVANTGTIVNISGGTNANVLPLSIQSGSSQLASYTNGSAATTGVYTGAGSPEGVVTANVGSTYNATDTGSQYVKTTGTGNIGWTVLGAGVAASYMQASLTSTQDDSWTTSKGLSNSCANNCFNANNHIGFNKVVASTGNDITLNTTSTVYSTANNTPSYARFTLKAGKTYYMTANIMAHSGANVALDTAWYDATAGQYIGSGNSIYSPNGAGNDAGGGVNTVVFAPSIDSLVEMRILNSGGMSATAGSTVGIDANRLPSAFIQVIGGNAPVVGQTVDLVAASLSADQTGATNGSDVIWNVKNNGNMALNTGGTFTLNAGKTYALQADLRFYSGTNSSTYLNFDWVDATTNATLQGGSTGFTEAMTNTSNESGYAPSRLTYTPSSNQTVKVRITGSSGSANLQSQYSKASITQIGTTASTGISTNFLVGALAAGSLDNTNYTQAWNWSTLTTGQGQALNFNALTSGQGVNLASASTGLTGSVQRIDVTGNSTSNTGEALLINIAGSANAAKGLRIANAGVGTSLDVQGAVQLRAGTTYTTPGSANDVALSNASFIRLDTSAAAQTLTGIAGGADGKLLTLSNTDAALTVTLANESTSSIAANRIVTGTGADLTIAAGASLNLIYDSTDSRWRVVGGTGGGSSQVVVSCTTTATCTTALGGVWNKTLLVDTNAGNVTVNLPTAVANSGKTITVKKTTSDANSVTVDASGSETIDGSLTATLTSSQSSLQLISNGTNVYTTGSLNAVGAEYGENTTITNNGTITGATITDVPGSSFTLPSAGTWRVEYNLYYRQSTANQFSTAIYDSSNTLVANSGSDSDGYATSAPSGVLTNTAYITTTGSATYKLRGAADVAGSVATFINTAMPGSNTGNSKVSWQKISGYQPVIGQTVDYLHAYSSASQNITAANQRVAIDTLDAGNIPLATNQMTLSAGKTYNLSAVVPYGALTNIEFRWYNETTGTYFGNGGKSSNNTNDAETSVATAVITPNASTVVSLKASAVTTGGTIGQTGASSLMPNVTITQLGSTNAFTGVTMSSLTAALASNALDNAGYTQTWNWNNLGANNGFVINSADTTTTGNLFAISNSSTAAATNGLARFNFSGAHTGNGLQLDDATASGTALAIYANSLTGGGNALSIQANALSSSAGLNVTSSSGALNTSLVNFNATGVANVGAALTVSNASTAGGIGLLINNGGLAVRGSGTDITAATVSDLTGTYSNVRLNPTATQTITGIANGSNGKLLFLNNVSSTASTTLAYNTGATGNKVLTPTSADLIIPAGGSAQLMYDGTAGTGNWRVIATTAGLYAPAYGSLTFSGSTSMADTAATFTVPYNASNSVSNVTATTGASAKFAITSPGTYRISGFVQISSCNETKQVRLIGSLAGTTTTYASQTVDNYQGGYNCSAQMSAFRTFAAGDTVYMNFTSATADGFSSILNGSLDVQKIN